MMKRSKTAMMRNLNVSMVSARTTRGPPPRVVMRVARKRKRSLRKEERSRSPRQSRKLSKSLLIPTAKKKRK